MASLLPASDLTAWRDRIRAGQVRADVLLDACVARARDAACAHAFIRSRFDAARREAADTRPDAVLAGLAVSIKDLFDVAGEVSAAGSVVLADAPAATVDCPSVARLRAAGGVHLGRTHMVEFAYSGVGTNPHAATPASVADAKTPRVPGGSSSGAAVSVASGAAFIGLGSDTGGSIRIPAALNGIVGFKNTARLVPCEGAVPLSTTLDTACAMTRSVRDAVIAHEVLAARRVTLTGTPLSHRRLALVRNFMLDGLDATVAGAFERSVQQLRAAGAQIVEIDVPALGDIAQLQAGGGFAAAESFHWHRDLLARRGADYDPRVRTRILRGADMPAWQYIELLHERQRWIARVQQALQGFDAALSPTVPIVPPPIASVAPGAERDDEFTRVNLLLLRNTSPVNLLDGCAISLPCHRHGELPVGLMLWSSALQDDTVLDLGLAVEAALAPVR
ncbi:MAG: amidase [Betaproteobacteria bacterium]|nr:amidase [Betaproteobacteria bacterium]